MNSVLQSVQAVEGVCKVCRGEGEEFDIAGVHLTWKVKAYDSAYSFSAMEATLAPGEGVPVQVIRQRSRSTYYRAPPTFPRDRRGRGLDSL